MDNQFRTVETKHSFSTFLELAANNDVEGFKQFMCNEFSINETGLWYGRHRCSKQMVLEQRTPLMVAAKYGSLDVVKLVLSLSEVDVNYSSRSDKSTALHSAASGGSAKAVDVVKLLLRAGADHNATDADGHRPFDVIVTPLNHPDLKVALEELLGNIHLRVSTDSLRSNLSPENDFLASVSDSTSPVTCKPNDRIYGTDEFRMFSFKIRPCSRAYSHDWTECPFVHPGENARRRDPRKYHYSCVPCPDFRRGTCRRGDLCGYAHGVFECWLHPAQYRTRICKDGISCIRRVCFFAHTTEELRPLYLSTGSSRSVTSASTAQNMGAALNIFLGSPSAVSSMSPSPFTPRMSPGNGISPSSMAWPPQNFPILHLPGSNLQMSRLRTCCNANELGMMQGFELQQQQLFNAVSCLSPPHLGSPYVNHSVCSEILTPSNLNELLSAEVSSPQHAEQLAASSIFFPSHKSKLLSQIQLQQSMLSPITTNVVFSEEH